MVDKSEYPFQFSFVMPLYNVESYLDETVQSILNQSIDFINNVEIIFINDGSPDNVEAICLKYKKQFPNNIKYITQSNKGVSFARNRGLEVSEGRYVSFLDSDDYISKDTLSEVEDFFNSHADVNVVSIKMNFFGAKKGPHMLNDKFHSTRVVDIYKEPGSIQLSGASSFVRSSSLAKLTFDTSLTVTEDAKLINEIIISDKKYGVLSKPTYYYRRRFEANSAINLSTSNPAWYLKTPEQAYQYLLEYSKNLNEGEVPRYVQNVVMYDLKWRFLQESQATLTEKELGAYKKSLTHILEDIDDEVIINQTSLPLAHKFFILELKKRRISYENLKLIYDQFKPTLQIDFLTLENNKLKIQGYFTTSIPKGYSLVFLINNTKKIPRFDDRILRRKTFLGDVVYDGGGFDLDLDLDSKDNVISALLVSNKDNNQYISIPIVTKRYTGLAQTSGAYRLEGGYITRLIKGKLLLKATNPWALIIAEIKWLIRIILGLKLRYSLELLKNQRKENNLRLVDRIRPLLIVFKAAIMNLVTVVTRCSYWIVKTFRKKPIWIISDRVNAAGDNGEALFRYIKKIDIKDINVYFAISKKSPDYHRISAYGKTIAWGSFRYRILFLLSSKIISSHADDFIINPFGLRVKDFQDLLRFKYVFLQHGITKDDMSSWLNRYNKNISLFITAAKPEYASLLDKKYGYDNNQVVLTGFPRYDLLDSRPANKVVIAPTWRKSLVGESNQRTGLRDYDANFKNSEYYKFYQNLLKDDLFNKALEQSDMTADFYLHPSHMRQISDFKGTARVTIKSIPYDYRTAFCEGNILVTDYSSVAFDFAYLKKSIVYSQFDRADFFESHLYTEGYFSYEDDGFGPVAYTYEDTVKEVIKMIQSKSRMKARFEKRVDDFFYKFDKHNSERVYLEIRKIKDERRVNG